MHYGVGKPKGTGRVQRNQKRWEKRQRKDARESQQALIGQEMQ